MRKEFLNVLNEISIHEYKLETKEENSNQIVTGFMSDGKHNIEIFRGVPCFLTKEGKGKWDLEQDITTTTFSEKWKRFKNYGMEENGQAMLLNWYCKKFGVKDIEELKKFYSDKKKILEVGPGSGFNSKFMAENAKEGYVIAADISEGAFTTYENTKNLDNIHVIQGDLMKLPFKKGTFDFIMADGVLHHTPNTKKAVFALYDLVKPGGQFFIYVYKKMSPLKQFSDSYIRESFSKMEPEECFEVCRAITDLGKALSDLNAEITLEKPIPILGIPAGCHSVQRLFYYNFLKCFWNDAFDYETNNMINFDWYHPHDAWQHTEQEVKEWMKELNVSSYVINNANPNGISVLLTK